MGLVRLLAIRLVRAGGVRQLDTLRRKLNAWAPADMDRWILTHPLAPATLAALGYPSTGQGDNPPANAGASNESIASGGFAASGEPRTGVAPTASGAAAPNALPSMLPSESWRRVTLMAWLELQIKGDAGPLVDRVAGQLVAHFAQMLTTRAGT